MTDKVPLERPDKYQPDWEMLSKAEGDEPFMEPSFELLKEAGILTTQAASIYESEPLSRNEAIRRAHLVKMARLSLSIVATTADHDGDQHLGMIRQLLETAANLNYLIDDPGDGSRYDAYIKNSLIAEKELNKAIEKAAGDRGEKLPIEERMMRSMKHLAEDAGFDMDEIIELDEGRNRSGWPKAEALIEALGPNAYVGYRAGSSVVHTTWTDLHRHYLSKENGSLVPNFDKARPRPQALTTPAQILARIVLRYQKGRKEEGEFSKHLNDLIDRVSKVSDAHEASIDRATST